MTQKITRRIAALAAAFSVCGAGALAGPEPSNPWLGITPAPPPPVGTPPGASPGPDPLTPPQVQAAQGMIQTLTTNPPECVSPDFQARALNVLDSLLESPDVLAQLDTTAEEIEVLSARVAQITSPCAITPKGAYRK